MRNFQCKISVFFVMLHLGVKAPLLHAHRKVFQKTRDPGGDNELPLELYFTHEFIYLVTGAAVSVFD